MTTTTKTPGGWQVQSTNFAWHSPVPAGDYKHAIETARARGFDAQIYFDGELVATWSSLYGVKVYDRSKVPS